MHDGILNYTKFGNLLIMAAPAGWQGGSYTLCPMPCPRLPTPSYRDKNYMCSLHPFHPLLQRKFYAKIHEMCQNIAQSILDFFLFPVVNGQSTCR